MKNNERALPIFGVGPVYVVSCLALTIVGLILKNYKLLSAGDIPSIKIPMMIVGVIFIVIGVLLWIYSVVIQKISEEIKNGRFLTTGVYSLVRNPIYSAFSFVFTGILIIGNNVFLLILPILFWIYLTVLLKLTEEKWLLEKFGEEYVSYCRCVNRIIPWFSKK
ncbi:hypothetical protein HMPREF0379_1526 [[Eubacterium] yurii subsp. margaretiae ATCC 43715]|nr:hypothetical protein HMPREF0379_1526 [[Eubacterium] yurii subsp. margaretiae ATCC 43715]